MTGPRTSAIPSGQGAYNLLIGDGPLELNPLTARLLNEDYLALPSPGFFIVAKDGRVGFAIQCKKGAGQCDFDQRVIDTLKKCSQKTGDDCRIFARGRDIVWKGPVTYLQVASGKRDLTAFDAKFICKRAAPGSNQGIRWSSHQVDQDFVREALRRKFDPIGCAATYILVRGAAPIDTSLSNGVICERALDTRKMAWRFSVKSWNYVREAVRRELSKLQCVIEAVRMRATVQSETPNSRVPRFGQQSADLPAEKSVSDKMLCYLATDGGSWNTSHDAQVYVNEAGRRGLGLQKCARYIPKNKREASRITNTGTLFDISDKGLCALSTAGRTWSTAQNARKYVDEARARGLDPIKCEKLRS